MASRCTLTLAWCFFWLISQAAQARVVSVLHSDPQIQYFPGLCLGDVGCDGCDQWWVSSSKCFKNRGTAAHSTKSPGSSLQFNFTGTEISLRAHARKSGGRARLSLDGVFEAEISTIAEHLNPSAVVWGKTNLANSAHTLSLVYDETPSDSLDDQIIHIVGFEYTIPDGESSVPVQGPMPTAISAPGTGSSTATNTPPNLVGIIVGTVGGVALLIALAVGFYFGRRWDHRRKAQKYNLPTAAPTMPPQRYLSREQPQPMYSIHPRPAFLDEPPEPVPLPRQPRRWTTMSDLSSAISIGRTDVTSYYDEKSPLKAQYYEDDNRQFRSPPPDGAV